MQVIIYVTEERTQASCLKTNILPRHYKNLFVMPLYRKEAKIYPGIRVLNLDQDCKKVLPI